jgi:catechol 2,3-dioxygenase-like lactoylglutathione lyase family enzyme
MSYTIRDLVPQLPILDMAKAKHFYCEVLGCTLRDAYPDFLILLFEGLELHLWLCDNKAIPESSSFYIRVTDIEALYQRFSQVPGIVLPLQLRPWGIKEFYIMDFSGNLLKFGEYVPQS